MNPPQTHLAQIMGLLGDFPPSMLAKGSKTGRYFDEQGKYVLLTCTHEVAHNFSLSPRLPHSRSIALQHQSGRSTTQVETASRGDSCSCRFSLKSSRHRSRRTVVRCSVVGSPVGILGWLLPPDSILSVLRTFACHDSWPESSMMAFRSVRNHGAGCSLLDLRKHTEVTFGTSLMDRSIYQPYRESKP